MIRLQELTGPWVRLAMTAITVGGSEEFLFLAAVVCFFTGRRTLGFRLAMILALSAFLNAELKHLFGRPRPSEVMPQLRKIYTQGLSFPSGHAQNSAAVWGYLGWRKGGKWLPALWLLVLLIGASRVVLGVHYPSDVAAGWAVGAILAFAAVRPAPLWDRKPGRAIGVAMIILAFLFSAWRMESHAARSLGLASGLLTAWFGDNRASGPNLTRRSARTASITSVLILLAFTVLKWQLLPAFSPPIAACIGFPSYFVLGYAVVRLSRMSVFANDA